MNIFDIPNSNIFIHNFTTDKNEWFHPSNNYNTYDYIWMGIRVMTRTSGTTHDWCMTDKNYNIISSEFSNVTLISDESGRTPFFMVNYNFDYYLYRLNKKIETQYNAPFAYSIDLDNKVLSIYFFQLKRNEYYKFDGKLIATIDSMGQQEMKGGLLQIRGASAFDSVEYVDKFGLHSFSGQSAQELLQSYEYEYILRKML